MNKAKYKSSFFIILILHKNQKYFKVLVQVCFN